MNDRPHATDDHRHELARVEQLVQQGWSQAEIEATLGDRRERPSSVVRILRRLLNVETKKAA